MKAFRSSRSLPGTVGNLCPLQAVWPRIEVVSGCLGGVTGALTHLMRLKMRSLARGWLGTPGIDATKEICAHG